MLNIILHIEWPSALCSGTPLPTISEPVTGSTMSGVRSRNAAFQPATSAPLAESGKSVVATWMQVCREILSCVDDVSCVSSLPDLPPDRDSIVVDRSKSS